jgi:hypothetical protein
VKNDAAWLHAMAATIQRMAAERSQTNPDLGYELRSLSVFTSSAALAVEDDDKFRSEEPTAPGHQTAQERVSL